MGRVAALWAEAQTEGKKDHDAFNPSLLLRGRFGPVPWNVVPPPMTDIYHFWLGEAGGPDLRERTVWLVLLEDGDYGTMVHLREDREQATRWVGPGFKRQLARVKVRVVEGRFDD